MTQLNNSVLWSKTLLVNLMVNFWWSTWCLVFTLVFHCCLCHIGPQVKKHSAPAPARFAIPNPALAGFEKIISGATLAVIAMADLSVQLSVYISHSGVLSRRMKIQLWGLKYHSSFWRGKVYPDITGDHPQWGHQLAKIWPIISHNLEMVRLFCTDSKLWLTYLLR